MDNSTAQQASGAPVDRRDRIAELDIIRGVALFGVLAGNLSEYILNVVATVDQLAALPTAQLDERATF